MGCVSEGMDGLCQWGYGCTCEDVDGLLPLRVWMGCACEGMDGLSLSMYLLGHGWTLPEGINRVGLHDMIRLGM